MGDDRALTFLPIEFEKDASNPRVVLTFQPEEITGLSRKKVRLGLK